jgi:hypothetical protein
MEESVKSSMVEIEEWGYLIGSPYYKSVDLFIKNGKKLNLLRELLKSEEFFEPDIDDNKWFNIELSNLESQLDNFYELREEIKDRLCVINDRYETILDFAISHHPKKKSLKKKIDAIEEGPQ